jgi:hypothetical protein
MQIEMDETREVTVKVRVSEVGNGWLLIHPSNDLSQSITILPSDVLAFGDKTEKTPKAA